MQEKIAIRVQADYLYVRTETELSMKKRISIISLVLALLLAGLVVAQSLMTPQRPGRGLLWEISGNGIKQHSYLFGTMHSDDPKVVNLDKSVTDAFLKARSFTAEVKMDVFSLAEMSKVMFEPSGRSLRRSLESNEYQRCIEIMQEYGIPESMTDSLQPWAIAITISLPKTESHMILDLKLYTEAMQLRKAVYGLETVEEQLSAFTNLDYDLQLLMLRDSIQNYHLLPQVYSEMLEVYVRGDLKGLQQIDEKYVTGNDKKVREFFEEELINKRNLRMVERMQARLREGNAFIAVGALHLPGEKGLINLLRQQGYQVRAVD